MEAKHYKSRTARGACKRRPVHCAAEDVEHREHDQPNEVNAIRQDAHGAVQGALRLPELRRARHRAIGSGVSKSVLDVAQTSCRLRAPSIALTCRNGTYAHMMRIGGFSDEGYL